MNHVWSSQKEARIYISSLIMMSTNMTKEELYIYDYESEPRSFIPAFSVWDNVIEMGGRYHTGRVIPSRSVRWLNPFYTLYSETTAWCGYEYQIFVGLLLLDSPATRTMTVSLMRWQTAVWLVLSQPVLVLLLLHHYVCRFFSTILVIVVAITFVALDGRDYWTTYIYLRLSLSTDIATDVFLWSA